MRFLIAILIAVSFIPVFSQSIISFDVDTTEFTPGQIVELQGKIETGLAGQLVSIEVKDGGGNVILIRTLTTEQNGAFTLTFKIPESAEPGKFDLVANVEIDGDAFSETKSIGTADEEFSVRVNEGLVEDLTSILSYLVIVIVGVIVGIIVIIKKKSRNDDEFSEDGEYEDDSIIETSAATPKFQEMQAGKQSDSLTDLQPHQIIEDKILKISKLQENKIGDYNKLENIKKSLINEGSFSQADNNYLEEKYEEYEKSKDNEN